jgi:hypothetical protein
VFRVKHANHFLFLNDEYSGRHNRSCSRRVYGLPYKTPYTKKIARSQDLYNSFFASPVDHGKLDTAFSNVNDILREVALLEDDFFASELGYLSPQTVRFKKQFHIEDRSF